MPDCTTSSPSAGRQTERSDEPVAVIGMGCRYPGGGDTPELYWEFLRDGGFAITEVSERRWRRGAGHDKVGSPGIQESYWGGFLADPFPQAFDAAFFDISPCEAETLDPQQRLLLEVAWRACEDAGLVPDPQTGRPVGVFVAISTTDHHGATLWGAGPGGIDAFTATGASFAAAAGRLSYVLGFEGPCLAIDTACSSSLVAVHQACLALRHGECEAAVVAGVNALLAPNLYACLGSMGLMAADGRSKAFDAHGDGYVRAEGGGAVILKSLDRAIEDGDRVLAVIRGSAVNQDGRSNGLTAPRRQAQEQVIGQALARAGLSARDVDYVEAHGTGTPLGDAIELAALSATYAAERDRRSPVLVGSAKTNIGHLEAGAGMAGLIKAVQCLRHGEIPAHLHLRHPTPEHDWDAIALEVPVQLTPWPVTGHPRRAAVSAFGFSGTNAHVVLEAFPASGAGDNDFDRSSPKHVLLPVSARTPDALSALSQTLADWLTAAPRDLADVAFTLGIGRAAFAYRKAVVGGTAWELAAALRGQSPTATGEGEDDPLRRTLEGLGRLWVGGGAVDWRRLYSPFGARLTEVPGHPLSPRHHWRDRAEVKAGCRAAPPIPASSRWIGSDVETVLARLDVLARQVLSDRPLDPLDPDQPLLEQGFTSLMTLELRKVLHAEFGVPVPTTFFFNYPSLRGMAGYFRQSLAPPESAPACFPSQPESRPRQSAEESFDFLDDLSAEDLASLIDRELELL